MYCMANKKRKRVLVPPEVASEEDKLPAGGGSRGTEGDKAAAESEGRTETEDEELERLAAEAILKEAKRGRARAEHVGAMGW